MGLSNALALLGGGAAGYVQGMMLRRQMQRQDEADARQKVLQQREDQQYAEQQADTAAARQAMAPTSVEEVQQPDLGDPEAAPPTSRFRVAGQMVDTRGAADAAAAQYNAQPARMQRAAAAVKNPVLAAKFANEAQASELGVMQLAKAKRDEAARKFDDDAHEAIWQGPQATADFLSRSHADGKGGAMKFQAVTDPQTNTWQIVRVADDGALVPFGGKYTDDDAGRIQALYQLSQAVSPADKAKHALEEARLRRQENRDAMTDATNARHWDVMDRYYQRLLDTKDDANDIKAGAAAGGGKKSMIERMPEDEKAVLVDLNKQLETINTKRIEAQANNMWQPDSPGAKAIQIQEARLLIQRDKLLAPYREKRATPAADPLSLRGGGGGSAPTKLDAVRADMKKTGVKDARVELSNPDEPYSPGGQAAAQPEQPRRMTPRVVDFSPNSGQKQRRAAAQSAVVVAQQAVDDAQAKVDAAKAQGPMAVKRARDALSNAKTALIEAQQRAGS